MSHFTSMKTKMVEQQYITRALDDLEYPYEVGKVQIRGYGGNRTEVEIKVPTGSVGYDIGFRKAGKNYEIVADWWGIEKIKQNEFQQQVTQRYAYNAALDKLQAQGFNVVNEDEQKEGERIHLTLRRMV